MKLKKLLKYLVPILLSSSVFAQDFYSYKLFNNKFQAVFPGKPSLEPISDKVFNRKRIENLIPSEYRKKSSPKEIKEMVSQAIQEIKDRKVYYYNDNDNYLSFTFSARPSHLSESNYRYSGIKKILDKQALGGLEVYGATKLIEYSSIYDRKKSTHVALYTFSFFNEGQKMYGSTKHIFYKDNIYVWSIRYLKLSDKSIFDNYQEYVKVLK